MGCVCVCVGGGGCVGDLKEAIWKCSTMRGGVNKSLMHQPKGYIAYYC